MINTKTLSLTVYSSWLQIRELNAFAIMNNHILLIWQVQKFELIKDDPGLLEKCKVNQADRKYQIWKREPLGIGLFTETVFNQKMDNIHDNPVTAGLCTLPSVETKPLKLSYGLAVCKITIEVLQDRSRRRTKKLHKKRRCVFLY